jgi:hypothetical protein
MYPGRGSLEVIVEGGPEEKVRWKDFHDGLYWRTPLEGTAVGGPLEEVRWRGVLQ